MGKRQTVAVPNQSKKMKAEIPEAAAVVPSVSEIGALSLAMPSASGAAAQAEADVLVNVLDFCSTGSIYGEQFSDGPLRVVHLRHNANPGVFYKFRDTFAMFLKAQGPKDGETPDTLEELESRYSMKIVQTGGSKKDIDKIGFIPFRLAWYVEGKVESVKNLVMLLDDFVAWRAGFSDEERSSLPKTPSLRIQVPPTCDLTINEKDEMACKFELQKKDLADVSVFDAMPPCFPNRVVVVTFEVTSTAHAHVIFSGNTKPFQNFFVAEAIPGKSVKTNPQDVYGEYFRVIHNMEFKSAQKLQWLEEVLTDRVLKRSPAVLRIKVHSFDDAPLKAFLQELCERHVFLKWT